MTRDLLPEIESALAPVVAGRAVGLERILIGSDALSRLAAQVVLVAREGPIVVLEDATPMRRGDDDLKATAHALLETVGVVNRVVLGSPDRPLHADAGVLEQAAAAVSGAGCVVTVGSGTITDIGKHACGQHPGLPLVVVQTAASVNGYADDMSVILKDGVKRTVPSIWPRVLIIDTEVLRDAPGELTGSGYAEMMAMFTAPADWKLAATVGMDSSFQQPLVDLFRADGEQLLSVAGKIGTRDSHALEFLARALTTSGLAMGVAGRTAPLSGTEHLISHLIDMSARVKGVPTGLHGAQVGVAAVVAATIWDWLLTQLDPDELIAALAPDLDAARARVSEAFGWLDDDGSAVGECWLGYQEKLDAWSRRSAPESPTRDWDAVVSGFRALLAEPGEMVESLKAVGAPTRFSELEPAVDPDRARWAVASCHLMRDRFTVADLAALTGRWSRQDVDEVLERAASWGGGL